jgi:amidase
MTEDDLIAADAVGLASLIRRRALTPVEAVEHALARIERLDAGLGAVVALDRQGALAQAAAVTRDLPLAGVPVLVKDTNVDVAGFATRHGSRFYETAPVATRDSFLVGRLRAAGAVIVGRSKTPEFASDYVTEPRFGGPARNPWDRSRATGGSSGGAAAAVAARMVPVAHGTDCGGSIRVPASACGLVGLKPTRGRVPEGPEVGERVSGMNVEGVLTRSLRDTALLLDVLSGPAPGAPYQAPPPRLSFTAALGETPRGLRIGVTARPAAGGTIAPEIAEALERTAELLTDLGHHPVPWEWPDVAGAGEAAMVFWQAEIAELVEARIQQLGRLPGPDDLETVSRRAWEETGGRGVLEYLRAKSAQNRISRAMAEAFAPIDLLLTPTTAELPPAVGAWAGMEQEAWFEAAYRYAPFSEIFNMTGQPAISLPVAMAPEGLPIGLQLAAKFGEEGLLLAAARPLEEAIGWEKRMPPLE